MKLELKHIAPYLPYGLRIKGETHGDIEELTGLSGGCVMINGNIKAWCDIFDVKPILRPLSDLTNEIEHNGEKFVPIEYLEDKYYTIDLHKQCMRLLEEEGENWINQTDYMLIDYLFEWHFDVFGLIDNNLAININQQNK